MTLNFCETQKHLTTTDRPVTIKTSTEVEIIGGNVSVGDHGVVIKADPRADYVCVDVYNLSYPVWFRKHELRAIGVVKSHIVNRHIWAEVCQDF